MTREWHSRDLPGILDRATPTDVEILRELRATQSSSMAFLDLRARLPTRDPGLRDSLWALEAGGLVEVLDSSTAGLICVLTARGREHIEHMDGRPPPRG
jgi:hypothetical protein